MGLTFFSSSYKDPMTLRSLDWIKHRGPVVLSAPKQTDVNVLKREMSRDQFYSERGQGLEW